MTDPTNGNIKNKKKNARKNIILIFGICISMIAISPFFSVPAPGLLDQKSDNEKVPIIHEKDTIAITNPNKKIRHNFLASYLLQETGIDRKGKITSNTSHNFTPSAGSFIIPLHRLFNF